MITVDVSLDKFPLIERQAHVHVCVNERRQILKQTHFNVVIDTIKVNDQALTHFYSPKDWI